MQYIQEDQSVKPEAKVAEFGQLEVGIEAVLVRVARIGLRLGVQRRGGRASPISRRAFAAAHARGAGDARPKGVHGIAPRVTNGSE